MQLFNPLLADDLQHIHHYSNDVWENFKNKTILITGGTGFIGTWLLESISYANNRLHDNANVIVISRDPDKFLERHPYFKQSTIHFVKGDIRNFDYPAGPIDYIIHAATPVNKQLTMEQQLSLFDTVVEGTRHVLELAREKNVRSFLLTSSGAVYGKQPSEMTSIPEEYAGAPDTTDPQSTYGEGKRASEMLCALYYTQYHVPVKIARCFAFIGPYLPLDSHFAIGNFIRNVLNEQDIVVTGDGRPFRSYLYMSDLVVWLLKILVYGKNNTPYNVGSPDAITIEQVASLVARCSGRDWKVRITQKADSTKLPNRYVPDVRNAALHLSLHQHVSLEDAIKKTLAFERGEHLEKRILHDQG